MALVNGKDVLLTIQDGTITGNVPIGCARGITFDIKRDMIETSVTGNGVFKSFVPAMGEVTANVDGLVWIQKEIGDKIDLGKVYNWIMAGTGFMLTFYETDVTGGFFLQKQVYAYLESVNETASFDNISTFSASFKCTGAPMITYGEV